MITKLEQYLEERKEIAKKIKELQKDRKRLNNAISQIKHKEKKKMSTYII